MIIVCTKCRQEMEAPVSAVGKKVRCPICGNVFVASLPKAQVLEDEPAESTASDALPIALPPQPQAEPDAEAPEADSLAQLAAAGLTPSRRPRARRPSSKAASARTDDAKKALESFAQAPSSAEVQWPGQEQPSPGAKGKGVPASKTAPRKARAKRRRVSKDVWYVIASEEYEYGPYTPQQILAAVRAGNIAPRIQLRHALTDSVITAARILQLLPQRPKKAQPRETKPPAAP